VPHPEHDKPDGRETQIDADGVDRAQIREMLALSPEERLRRVEEFLASVFEIAELNGTTLR